MTGGFAGNARDKGSLHRQEVMEFGRAVGKLKQEIGKDACLGLKIGCNLHEGAAVGHAAAVFSRAVDQLVRFPTVHLGRNGARSRVARVPAGKSVSRIHATAIVAPEARIAEDVEIGPFCRIGAEVEIEAGSVLMGNVLIEGRTRIGAGTRIHPFASLGQPPQYAALKAPPGGLQIGRNNVIYEYVTMNTGMSAEGNPTSVGDNGSFMPGAHVAHDCHIGDHVVMATKATLAGHVSIGDHAVIDSLTAIHQNSRIGKHALIGASTAVGKDIVPFAIADGRGPQLRGLNIASLRQWNFAQDDIRALRDAYRELFLGTGHYTARLDKVAERFHDIAVVMDLVDFITADASRPICTVTAVDE